MATRTHKTLIRKMVRAARGRKGLTAPAVMRLITECYAPPVVEVTPGSLHLTDASDLTYLLSATLGPQPAAGDEFTRYTYAFDPASWLMRPGYPTITDALTDP